MNTDMVKFNWISLRARTPLALPPIIVGQGQPVPWSWLFQVLVIPKPRSGITWEKFEPNPKPRGLIVVVVSAA